MEARVSQARLSRKLLDYAKPRAGFEHQVVSAKHTSASSGSERRHRDPQEHWIYEVLPSPHSSCSWPRLVCVPSQGSSLALPSLTLSDCYSTWFSVRGVFGDGVSVCWYLG